MRTTGNKQDGYVCVPFIEVRVKLMPVQDQWLWEVWFARKLFDCDIATGERAAATAATKCVRTFSKNLYSQVTKQP